MQRAEPLSESKKNELRRRLLDGTGDFNNDGTPDILQHQINHNDGSMTLRALQMNPNAVQVQSRPGEGTVVEARLQGLSADRAVAPICAA